MKQEIEIEFKNLLTKEEFDILTSKFQLDNSHFITQENHYFDTANFSIKANHSALRIRKKQDAYVLTLKQPYGDGLLETHQQLTEQQAFALLDGESFLTIKGKIKEQLAKMNIDFHDILYLGTLTTNRAELAHKGNILVFDHSYYLDIDDYEVEYEVKEALKGKEQFNELLAEYDILIKPTENKVARFFNEKMRQQSSL